MLRVSGSVITLFLMISFLTETSTQRDHHAEHTAAFVMPITTIMDPIEGTIDYVLLGCESSGRDRGTFDAFGGKRDDLETPIETAAREFAEEAITHETIGMDQAAIMRHLDTQSHTPSLHYLSNSSFGTHLVLYITRFTTDQINALRHRFPKAHRNATSWKFKEKNALALVRFDVLQDAIRNSVTSTRIQVLADVTNLDRTVSKKKIILRPVLVKCLKCYDAKSS